MLSEEVETILACLLIALFSICILVIILCFYVIYRTSRQSRTLHQGHILANLFVVEFFFSLIHTKIQITNLCGVTNGSTHQRIELFYRLVFGLAYVLTMHCIAVDRLLEMFLHLSYANLVTKRRTVFGILGVWVVCVLFGAVCMTLEQTIYTMEDIFKFAFFFFFATDITFLINAFITYGYLYSKFLYFRKLTRRLAINSENTMSFKAPKFLLPLLIILSYLVFDITATFLSMAAYFIDPTNSLYRYIGLMLYCFSILSHTWMYIFLQPRSPAEPDIYICI